MKQLILCAMLCATILGAQEIRRPQNDSDGGPIASSLGCGSGADQASSSLTQARDAAGLSTSSLQVTQGASNTYAYYETRIFKNWQSPGSSYSALVLNINSASSGYFNYNPSRSGSACVVYSTNGGASWTQVRCDSGNGWAQTTDTITLSPAQNLATLQVAICTQGNAGINNSKVQVDPGGDDITLWDIWTLGSTTSASAGNGNGSGNAHRTGVIFF